MSMKLKITSICNFFVSRTDSGANNILDNIWKGQDQIKLIQLLRIVCKDWRRQVRMSLLSIRIKEPFWKTDNLSMGISNRQTSKTIHSSSLTKLNQYFKPASVHPNNYKRSFASKEEKQNNTTPTPEQRRKGFFHISPLKQSKKHWWYIIEIWAIQENY